MIPTHTPYGRHAVQTLHLFYGLPVDYMHRGHRPPWAPNNSPSWLWDGGDYRIQPAALRGWMGNANYLAVLKDGGVTRWMGVANLVYLGFWHRDEILDPEPPRGPTYPRLGLPGRSEG